MNPVVQAKNPGPEPEAVSKPRHRTFVFQVPETARKEGDPRKITLRELTGDQQIDALRAAGGDRVRTGIELAKAALYAVDDAVVDHAAFGAEKYWAKWSPKVRSLLVQGYTHTHNSSDAEDAAFLGSMAVE